LGYGINVLLDALGTKVSGKEKLKEKVDNFDVVDDRLNKNIDILRYNLHSKGYNDLISSGTIYDNFQIFLPLDINIPGHVDLTGKNDWYWSLIIVGNLLIDFFRDAICHKIPLRGCIASGYGEMSKTNRVLGPIANEASKYYQLADWAGIIVTNHPSIILNNKISINPQKELYEPYVKYDVPIKHCIIDSDNSTYRIEYRRENFWTLRWPIQQGFERKDTEKLIYVSPLIRTEYGDIISDDTIMQIITEYIKYPDPDISRKWNNTLDYFNSVKS
jgi:hypothetical protein